MLWLDPVRNFDEWNPAEVFLTGDLSVQTDDISLEAMALIRSTVREGDTLLDVFRNLSLPTPFDSRG